MIKIVLLRGINVSGKNLLKMADLKVAFTNKGFRTIQTYIQSGNIVLESDLDSNTAIAEQIEQMILDQFGLTVPTLVFDARNFELLVKQSPFLKESEFNPAFQHYTFLGEGTNMELSLEKKIQQSEEVTIAKNVVYLYLPNGYGQTKLTNTWIEQQLKRKATTRNYNTCLKLIEMSKKL